MRNYEQLNLSNVLQGSIEEKFQYELKKVSENIQDENTPYKTKRTLTVEISFTPEDDRTTIKIEGSMRSKLAPVKTDSGNISLIGNNGKLEMYTNVEKQSEKKQNEIDVNFNEGAQ